MLETSPANQVELLLNQIDSKKKKYEGKKILTLQQEKLIQSARYYPAKKYILELQDILKIFEYYLQAQEEKKPQINNAVEYFQKLMLNISENNHFLKKISNHEGSREMYLFFNENFIKDFNKLDPLIADKFRAVCSDIKFAAGKNEQGLKHMKDNKGHVKCIALINEVPVLVPFSHEIKINGSLQRVMTYCLKPVGEGPDILIATHLLNSGLHNNQHNGKKLCSNNLSETVFDSKTIKFPSKTSTHSKLNRLGLFKTEPQIKQNQELPIINDSLPAICVLG